MRRVRKHRPRGSRWDPQAEHPIDLASKPPPLANERQDVWTVFKAEIFKNIAS